MENFSEDTPNNDRNIAYEDPYSDFRDYERNQFNHSSPNVFSSFAKALGIFSIICAIFSIFFGTFICGGLAIVLAIVSQGYDMTMNKNARIGLSTGIIAIVLQIAVLAVTIYNIIYIPEFQEQFNEIYEQIYGEPFEDSIDDIWNTMEFPEPEGGTL